MSARPPQELLARHEAFLLRQPVDRPLLGFWLGGYYPAEQFPNGTAAWREGQALQPQDVRLERFLPDYERLWRLHRDVDDDFFYVGSAYWGIPWLEAILGCPIVAGQATCWAEPCLESLAERCLEQLAAPCLESLAAPSLDRLTASPAPSLDRSAAPCPDRLAADRLGAPRLHRQTASPAPSLDRLTASHTPVSLDDNRWWQCLLQFTRELVRFAAGRFPVCPPLLRGPGDAAAALRGAMKLTPEYLRDPAGVERLLAHCTDVRMEVVRRLAGEIPAWHGTHVAGGYPSKLWSRRTVAYSQEDSAALLSPKLFRRFLLPLHRRMCAAAEIARLL